MVEVLVGESMGPGSVLVRMAENGRLSIPAKQRKLLGLGDGGLLVVEVLDGELRLRPIDDLVTELQARVRKQIGDRGGSDRLLAMRREEAAREGL